jgi:succinate dehydrogenase / fumarate reductase, iron-sulfur subunit
MSSLNLTLKIWRQRSSKEKGSLESHKMENISTDMSFLEMLDILNDRLEREGKEPVIFDHDCREGICGMCSLFINGQPHGPERATTTCQLHMRSFKDGETIVIEPWRSSAFPVVRDLMVDRSSFDRIIQSGGYTSAKTGSAPEANIIPIPKVDADLAMDAAGCIGCGACVASCKNASASLFTAAKISHLALLPQGKVERTERAINMVNQMDEEGFGHCTNEGECEAACPKEITVENIARMNREFIKASAVSRS